MKTLTFFLLVFTFISVSVCQTFQLKWAVPGNASYVGDLDNDGIGEIAVEEHQSSITFYDASTHSQKWQVPLGSAESMYSDYTSFYDLDGNGIKDIIIWKAGMYSGHEQLRICDPSTNTTIFTFPHEGDFYQPAVKHNILVANIDNDPTAELLIKANDSLYIYSRTLHYRQMRNRLIYYRQTLD